MIYDIYKYNIKEYKNISNQYSRHSNSNIMNKNSFEISSNYSINNNNNNINIMNKEDIKELLKNSLNKD